MKLICDAIKLNQSVVDPGQFSGLHFIVEQLLELDFGKSSFQRFDQFSVTQNNQVLRKLRAIIGFISKSIFLTNDRLA